jgi:hypothetical protein
VEEPPRCVNVEELAHEDSDVEKRADTAYIPEIALVRRAAQPLDVRVCHSLPSKTASELSSSSYSSVWHAWRWV